MTQSPLEWRLGNSRRDDRPLDRLPQKKCREPRATPGKKDAAYVPVRDDALNGGVPRERVYG